MQILLEIINIKKTLFKQIVLNNKDFPKMVWSTAEMNNIFFRPNLSDK